jgi:hypothetical protein
MGLEIVRTDESPSSLSWPSEVKCALDLFLEVDHELPEGAQ